MADKLDELTKSYEAGAATLNIILDDITWRRKDVAMEEKALEDMKKDDPLASSDDFESQEIVVRSARAVLDNQIKDAEELDVALKNLKAQIEKLAAPARTSSSSSDSVETVP